MACNSKLGKFHDEVTRISQLNDSSSLLIKQIDTNYLLSLRSKSKIMFLKFNIELGNDTLDLDKAKEIDTFIQAYRATDFFTSNISKLRQALLKQKERMSFLISDIESGAGERSEYFTNVKSELDEATQIQKHAELLEHDYSRFTELFMQFKPIFDRFTVKHDSIQ